MKRSAANTFWVCICYFYILSFILLLSAGWLMAYDGNQSNGNQAWQRYNQLMNNQLRDDLFRHYPWLTNAVYQSLISMENYSSIYHVMAQEKYRQDWMHHPRNTQHYQHNLFKGRSNEFTHMMTDSKYALEKSILTLINAGMTRSLSYNYAGYHASNALKSENVLRQNALLNILYNNVGTDKVRHVPGYMSFDVHVHSHHSFDGTSNLRNLLLMAHKKGLNAIAITDHDFFDETYRAQRLSDRLKKEGKLPPIVFGD
ncbi:MAG: PHP domain-containing protein [Caldithrix sp.]|nr:PHP domain-containing protein [Caldithrix sp.]